MGILAGARPAAAGEVYVSRDAHGNVSFTDAPVGDHWRRHGREPAPINPYLNYQKQKTRYDALIEKYARWYELDPILVKAMMRVESHFDPRAVSAAGAHGLLQLMPATAARYGVRDMFDPEQNIQGGTRYLRDLLRMFDGNVRLALAAYNCGEHVVMRVGRVPDIPETQDYVRKVLRTRAYYRRVGLSEQEVPGADATRSSRGRASP